MTPADARAGPQLRVAVMRGLLLDLFAAGDGTEIDRPQELIVEMRTE